MAAIPHSVKHGPPPLIGVEVDNYMSTHPEYNELGVGDNNQVLNANLLQIISQGINNIVNQLKMRLGSNFTESNQNAFAIKEMLNTLKTQIDDDSGNIGHNNVLGPGEVGPIGQIDQNLISISRDPRTGISNPVLGNQYYRTDLEPLGNIRYNTIDIPDNYNFENLDSPNLPDNKVVPSQRLDLLIDDNVELNIPNIEKRLRNCQNLEFLYLKKHNEIMKIFAFTINLFDKYKYAIKIILFLLKNLVYKPVEPGNPNIPINPDVPAQRINLPKTIIRNIKNLVRDQKLVEGVINKMKSSIIDTDINIVPTSGSVVNRTTLQRTTGPDISQGDERNIDTRIVQ